MQVEYFIAGIIFGFFSGIGSIIVAVCIMADMAEKRRREPSREDWHLR